MGHINQAERCLAIIKNNDIEMTRGQVVVSNISIAMNFAPQNV